MRFLFKIIVLPILALSIVPISLALLMYKPVEIPVDDYSDSENIDFESLLMEEFESLTLDASSESTIKIQIDQKTLNGIIRNALREMNPNYLNENAEDEDRLYVLKEDLFAYQGSWARFKKNNIVEIESGAHIFIGGFTFKTRLLLAFQLEIEGEEIVLTLKKVTIGNLPLAWVISGASWLANKFMGQSLDDIIAGMISGIGTFDPVKREVRVNIKSLLEDTSDGVDSEGALVQTLIQFVLENKLIDIGFEENNFHVTAYVGKIYDETTPFELKASEKIKNEEELETILLSKASSVILSTISKETPYLKLDDFTLNRVLEYFLRNGIDDSLATIDIFEGYEAVLKTPYVNFEDVAIINIPLIIKQKDLNDGFKTIIKIHATPEIVGSDLYFHLENLEAGTLTIGEENIKLILSLIEDNDIIKNGAIVLENFDEMMQSSGIDIKDVAVKNNQLYLYIQINMFEDRGALEDLAQSALNIPDLPEELQETIQNVLDNINEDNIDELINEMIGEMIETALESIVDNPAIPEEVQGAIVDILDNIADPEALDEAIANAIDIISGLEDGDQEDFFNDFLGSLEGTGMSYEDLLGLLG